MMQKATVFRAYLCIHWDFYFVFIMGIFEPNFVKFLVDFFNILKSACVFIGNGSG